MSRTSREVATSDVRLRASEAIVALETGDIKVFGHFLAFEECCFARRGLLCMG
jgi:hypothetical protein